MVSNVNNTNDTSDSLGRYLSNILTSIPLPDYQLNKINVFQQDLESGYTPLHQALNYGYIYKAFLLNESFKKKDKKKKSSTSTLQSGGNSVHRNPWKLRDNDGLTPLELYMNKFFSDPKSLKKYPKNENTCRMYGFGKVINVELGLGNNNDSLKEIDLNGIVLDYIRMNRTRAILIDSNQRLYMFKLKHIGEIIEKNAFKSFLQEPYPEKRFLKCSISNTHTIATTDTNELVIFGDNEYGQCSIGPSSSAATGNILFISCSNVSSCLINSKNQLISWGLNTGQFGNTEINCSNNKKVNFNNISSYLAKKYTVVDLPDSLGDIKQLIQLDYVTLILHGDNGLLVLSNFRKYHFYIPPLGTKEHSFNTKVSHRLTLGNKVAEIFVKDPFANNILAKFENGILGYFSSSSSKDSTYNWRSQLFQLPFKVLYKPENNLLKNYHLDLSDSKDSLKCGLLNFFGDYSYFSSTKSNQFQHKIYHKLLQDAECLVSDSDCNNFLVLKKDYSYKIDQVNNYKNLAERWLNWEMANVKFSVDSLKMSPALPQDYKIIADDNFDLEIVGYRENTIVKLHKFVLQLVAPNNILFASEMFLQKSGSKLKYLSESDSDIEALRESILYLYLGKAVSIDRIHKFLSSTLMIKDIFSFEKKVSDCLNKGSIEIKTKSGSLFCEKQILIINSLVFQNLFMFNKECSVIDFSNFEMSTVVFLLKYFHLFNIKQLLANGTKTLELNVLIELICLSDYLILPDLKNYIEYMISCSFIKSEHFVTLVLISKTYGCDDLFDKLCEFLFLNIGILFEDDRLIEDIKNNFSFKVWESLETKLRSLMNIEAFDSSNVWYKKTNFRDLLGLFSNDLPKWNKVFNDRFVIENKKKNTNTSNRKPSISMSRSSSISSNTFSEKPKFTNPWATSTKKSTAQPSTGDENVSVFDDLEDETLINEQFNIRSQPKFSYSQASYRNTSQDSFENSRKDDDFILISKTKRSGSTANKQSEQLKSKEKVSVPGFSKKIIPGSQLLKTSGKRKVSSKGNIQQDSVKVSSTTRISIDSVKTFADETPPKTKPETQQKTKPETIKKGPELPTLSSLTATTIVEKRTISSTQRVPSTSINKTKTVKSKLSGSSTILSVKDKTNAKVVSNNVSLEDMISMVKKDTKKSTGSTSVWFQDTPIVSKSLAKTEKSITFSTLNDSQVTNKLHKNSKWDYTKDNTTSKKTISLEEMLKNMKKK